MIPLKSILKNTTIMYYTSVIPVISCYPKIMSTRAVVVYYCRLGGGFVYIRFIHEHIEKDLWNGDISKVNVT